MYGIFFTVFCILTRFLRFVYRRVSYVYVTVVARGRAAVVAEAKKTKSEREGGRFHASKQTMYEACSVYEEGGVPIGKKISQCATRAGYSATFRISRIIGDPLILIL